MLWLPDKESPAHCVGDSFVCWDIIDNLNLHISKKYRTFAAQNKSDFFSVWIVSTQYCFLSPRMSLWRWRGMAIWRWLSSHGLRPCLWLLWLHCRGVLLFSSIACRCLPTALASRAMVVPSRWCSSRSCKRSSPWWCSSFSRWLPLTCTSSGTTSSLASASSPLFISFLGLNKKLHLRMLVIMKRIGKEKLVIR